MDWLVLCPWCGGPATVTTNWRGDRIGTCAAYRPCTQAARWSWQREPQTWLVDKEKPWVRTDGLRPLDAEAC